VNHDTTFLIAFGLFFAGLLIGGSMLASYHHSSEYNKLYLECVKANVHRSAAETAYVCKGSR